jgi:hypothetical protein
MEESLLRSMLALARMTQEDAPYRAYVSLHQVYKDSIYIIIYTDETLGYYYGCCLIIPFRLKNLAT